MAKKGDFVSLADFRIGKIREGLETKGRCEVICATPEEREQLDGFIVDPPMGVMLPRAKPSDSTRLFTVVGNREAV